MAGSIMGILPELSSLIVSSIVQSQTCRFRTNLYKVVCVVLLMLTAPWVSKNSSCVYISVNASQKYSPYKAF